MSENACSGIRLDLFLLLLVAVASGYLGHNYFKKNVSHTEFYQDKFGPAVTVACGKGFIDIDTSDSESLSEFLLGKRDRFECSYLPEKIKANKHSHWTDFQYDHMYLIGLVGLFWKVTAISWSGMAPLIGLFNGIISSLLYALFRLGMGRALSLLLSLILVVSPLQAGMLLHYRDFSKAPFVLAFILIISLMVTREMERRTLLFWSVILGLTLGLGLGFRQDIIICIPFFPFVLFLFVPGYSVARFMEKAFAFLLFLLAFYLAGYPIITYLAEGSNSWHVALVGLLPVWDKELSIITPPEYEWLNSPFDGYIVHVASGYWNNLSGHTGMLEYQTREYDYICLLYYFELVKHFPADFLVRYYAAIIGVLEMPFRYGSAVSPDGGDLYIALTKLREFSSSVISGWGVYLAMVALFIIGLVSIRLAGFVTCFIMYFAGYPFIQFGSRHYFHLEFITLWTTGFVVWTIITALVSKARNERSYLACVAGANGARSALFTIIVIGLLASSLYATRRYQQAHLSDLFDRYQSATTTSLQIWSGSLQDEKVIVGSQYYLERDEPSYMDTYYLRADFDLDRCGKKRINGSMFYHSKKGSNNYSAPFTLYRRGNQDKKASLFFPAFVSDITMFVGLELARNDEQCMTGLFRIESYKDLPLLLYLYLSDGWQDQPLYTTIY